MLIFFRKKSITLEFNRYSLENEGVSSSIKNKLNSLKEISPQHQNHYLAIKISYKCVFQPFFLSGSSDLIRFRFIILHYTFEK